MMEAGVGTSCYGTAQDGKGNGMECYTMGQERMTKVMEWSVTQWDKRG